MQRKRIFIAGLLAISLLGALPVRAAESTAAPKESPGSGLGSTLFTPEPLYLIGRITGPCTISVRCAVQVTISCTGQSYCLWRGDNPPISFGYVNCDGVQTSCNNIP
jgi:hypothetical protein